MHFYRTIIERSGLPTAATHHATLADARAAAKAEPIHVREYTFVELIDVPSDKSGILGLLRGYSVEDFTPLRNWRLTRRGGLEEIPVELETAGNTGGSEGPEEDDAGFLDA